jgi:hypothetical protein
LRKEKSNSFLNKGNKYTSLIVKATHSFLRQFRPNLPQKAKSAGDATRSQISKMINATPSQPVACAFVNKKEIVMSTIQSCSVDLYLLNRS